MGRVANVTVAPADNHIRNWVWLDPAGRRGPLPAVPAPVRLGVSGRAWWKWGWRQPQALMWDESMVQTVARRASLEDMLADNPTPALLSEIRHRDDALGLSPRALLTLHWRIGHPPPVPDQSSGVVRIV